MARVMAWLRSIAATLKAWWTARRPAVAAEIREVADKVDPTKP